LRLYLPEKKATVEPSTYTGIERHLLRYGKPLHGLGVALVSRRDVASLLAALAASSGGPTANRVRCIARGLVEANPVLGTNVAPETPRARVLPVTELAAVWRACNGDAYGTIVKLLMLSGCRAGEIGGLRFDEIRDGMIVLPANRVKNKRAHLLPLAAPASRLPPRRKPFSPAGRSATATSFSRTVVFAVGPTANSNWTLALPPPACSLRRGRCMISGAASPPTWAKDSASRRTLSRRS
jgi:integrase